MDPGLNVEEWIVYTRKAGGEVGETTLKAVDAHEYTHGIFSQNMGRYSAEWRDWQKSYRERYRALDPEIQKLANRHKVANDNMMRFMRLADKDPEKEAFYKRQIGILVDQMSQIQNEMSRLYKQATKDLEFKGRPEIYKFSQPYQEIMSDLGGIIERGSFKDYREDLMKILTEGVKPQIDLIQGRGFIDKVPVEGWNQRLTNLTDEERKHALFNPTRSFLYDAYLSKPQTMKRMNEFMPKLFDALAKEVVERHPTNKKTDAETLNKLLMDRLKQSLREFE